MQRSVSCTAPGKGGLAWTLLRLQGRLGDWPRNAMLSHEEGVAQGSLYTRISFSLFLVLGIKPMGYLSLGNTPSPF